MTSVNDVGFTDIALEFNPNRNIDTAAQDVQEATTRTLPQLPAGMPNPPSCQKLNRADLALLDFLSTIDKSVERVIAQTGSSLETPARRSVRFPKESPLALARKPHPSHISATGHDLIAVQNTRSSSYRFLIFRGARDSPLLSWVWHRACPSKLA